MNGAGAADLNTSMASVSMRYRHENQNSIYYLRPNSVDIYFLDFRLQGFVKEQMRWNRGRGVLPTQMSSIQTTDANIFVVGGTRATSSGQTILHDTLQIDANLTVYDKEPMKTARFHIPLALIRDRFVLALGGFTSRQQATKTCECYDTWTNYWFNINPLPTQSINTTAVVMNERWIYLMPGANREAQFGNHLFINVLDTGSTSIYEGDKNSRDYGAPIARQKWA